MRSRIGESRVKKESAVASLPTLPHNVQPEAQLSSRLLQASNGLGWILSMHYSELTKPYKNKFRIGKSPQSGLRKKCLLK